MKMSRQKIVMHIWTILACRRSTTRTTISRSTFTLNSGENYAVGSPQYNFVRNDLGLTSHNPNVQWILVTIHEPAYSSPNSCSSCKAPDSLSDTYHPLFDQYGVDLVLEGHVHNYQRSYPISYNINNPLNPIITDSSKTNYINPKVQCMLW
jgi:hypothetical protein